MKISPQDLHQMLARNPQVTISENQAQGQLHGTKLKRNEAPTLARSKKRETRSVPSVTISFTGYRVRPLDPDNFAGGCKDLLDGLRHSGLIPGDAWWEIKLETSQVKVGKYREEATEIEIVRRSDVVLERKE